ncbi:MAG: NAD(P)H-dependent oxidoreductase [Candidatus Heimdallarchaeota archaeon]
MILGSPVYQENISGQLKTLFDRCRAVVAKNSTFFEKKISTTFALVETVLADRNPLSAPFMIFISLIMRFLWVIEPFGESWSHYLV